MSRDLFCLGAVIQDGMPVIAFMCDCTASTNIHLEGWSDDAPDTVELAFTCGGCNAVHWFTVSRSEVGM